MFNRETERGQNGKRWQSGGNAEKVENGISPA